MMNKKEKLDYKAMDTMHLKKRWKLQQTRDRYKKALEIYANRANYKMCDKGYSYIDASIVWEIAEQALKETGENNDKNNN